MVAMRNCEVNSVVLECFKHALPFGTCCSKQQGAMVDGPPVTIEHIMEQVMHGRTTCPGCGATSDLREQMRHMSVFGQPESLFGLQRGNLDIAFHARSVAEVDMINLREGHPVDGEIVYAVATPQGPPSGEGKDVLEGKAFLNSIPWVIAPQASHHPWNLNMAFFVPAGQGHRMGLNFVVKPLEPLPLARELALQAVENFHRRQLNIASVLLAASVEASLRPRVEGAYRDRSVKVPADLGFASLIERAQMHFQPAFGAQLLGHLRALAKKGRNPAAHGNHPNVLSAEDVGMWMVDVAVVYEWSRYAQLR